MARTLRQRYPPRRPPGSRAEHRVFMCYIMLDVRLSRFFLCASLLMLVCSLCCHVRIYYCYPLSASMFNLRCTPGRESSSLGNRTLVYAHSGGVHRHEYEYQLTELGGLPPLRGTRHSKLGARCPGFDPLEARRQSQSKAWTKHSSSHAMPRFFSFFIQSYFTGSRCVPGTLVINVNQHRIILQTQRGLGAFHTQ